MPLYDYECLTCANRFEIRQKVSEVGNAPCPTCASDSRRVFHSVPILFKGSGFYSTDHRKGQASSTANEKDDSSESKSSSDSDSKPKAESSSSDKSSEKSADKVASASDS